MSKRRDFCCVQNFGVLLPYHEVEELVRFAKNLEQFKARLSRLDEQVLALRMVQSETIEKVQEILENL